VKSQSVFVKQCKITDCCWRKNLFDFESDSKWWNDSRFGFVLQCSG